MTTATPYHLSQIERSLPHWSRLVPGPHLGAMLGTLRQDYRQENGQPFDWYAKATATQRQSLHRAIAQRDRSRKALHKSLEPLQGITEFCKPLLEKQLQLSVPVDEAVYFFQPFVRRPDVLLPGEAGLISRPEPGHYAYDADGKPRKVTLLEAAMHNFTGPDEAGPYSLLQNSKRNATRLVGHTPASFIEACRDLDLGQQYQQHLTSIYDSAERVTLEQQSIRASQDELRVQAHLAVLRGKLSSQGLEMIEHLCAASSTQRPTCWRVSLNQIALHEVMVIGTYDADQVTPRIVYIPGAHDAPVVEYPSASAAASALALRLQDERLLQQVIRYAPQALQPQLAGQLRRQLFDTLVPPNAPGIQPKPSPRLHYQATALPAEPWTPLYRAHVRRLKADAASLAVPTAQVDANARLEQMEHWLSIGLDLANVAALFIPGLNAVMLAVGGAQLMNSVFHGIEAWEDDNKAEAAAQLESVLLNLALVGTVGGGVALLRQSRFVDSLLRIEHAGGERLWQADLDHYASTEVLPDTLETNEQGQYRQQQRHFIRLDGKLYEQSRTPAGQWRLNHPVDVQAYRPAVRPVGQGAWRVTGEHPLDWQRTQLLRRIGPLTDNLGEADLDTALRCTGIDEQVLRHTHVSEAPAPALLTDAVQRLAIDQEASDLITRVRQGRSVAPYKQYALNSLVELDGWPQDHVLKVFAGPEPWGTATIHGNTAQLSPVVIEVTGNDLELGNLSKTVLAQLDEQAASALVPGTGTPSSRVEALNEQLANHLAARRNALFDALYQSRQPALDSAAEALRRQFASLPARILNEITLTASTAERARMLSGRIPLRIAEEARVHQAHLRLDRALLGLCRPTLANADSQRLAAALLARQPGASPAELVEAALADRQQAARLIGQQPIRPGYRSPLRLADGRLGYPLSGRGSWRDWRLGGESIEERRLQELYPSLDRQQRRTLLNQLQQRGNVGEQLAHLQRQQAALDQSLRTWSDATEGETRRSHRAFGRALRRAARQDDGTVLNLRHMTLDTLPELPARFDHIQVLHIHAIDLRTLPAGFFQAFPRLQALRISGNPQLQADSLFSALHNAPQLRTLEVIDSPLGQLGAAAREALARPRRLRALRLRNAELSVSDADLQVIAGMPLEELDLSSNQITLTPALAARFGEMQHLRELDLSSNPLVTAPALANLHQLRILVLNDCNLTAWPDGLTSLMNRQGFALRNVELSDNDIHELPELERILDTHFARNLLGRENLSWEFHFNNLPPETFRALRTTGVAIIEQDVLLPQAAAVDWRANGNQAQQQLWDSLFEEGANGDLREVVERVGRSAQAQHNQPSLAREIWQLLQAASQDQALREHLNEIAADFPPTCGDAGADGFSTLLVEQLAYGESSQADIQGPHLFQFYRRLFRREQVNRLAARIHAARQNRQTALLEWQETPVESRAAAPMLPNADSLDDITLDELLQGGLDDIEIRLALRQSLAQPLEFPEPSQDMLYRESAQVSNRVIDNVENAVTELDETPAIRRAWITEQPGWRRFLRRRFSQRFAALDERWYRAIEYLAYCLDPESEAVTSLDATVREVLNEVLPAAVPDAAGQLPRLELNSQQYNAAASHLGNGRQAEEDALYQRLTAQQDPNDQD
ncbi:NEL-type E3 ubiquitin ligase domain-containing protein [Pseudomonas putida]|uniref:NEL-type E3 ubiquitin ligase domain-containing protein n=1 Tax=Pseudomonas putida TaxID=303 RepID=UPI00300F069B